MLLDLRSVYEDGSAPQPPVVTVLLRTTDLMRSAKMGISFGWVLLIWMGF